MAISKGFEVEGANRKDYVLKIHRNIYGQKQAGRVWNKYLVDKLVNKVGFKQSKASECVFYKGNVIYVRYTDDSILAGPDQAEIDKIIQQIKQAKLNIMVEGDIQEFLGFNITRKEDGTIEFTQPHLVDKVLEAMGLKDTTLLTMDTQLQAPGYFMGTQAQGHLTTHSISGQLWACSATWTRGQEATSPMQHTNVSGSWINQGRSMETLLDGWPDTSSVQGTRG